MPLSTQCPVDWNAVKLAYVQGFTFRELSNNFKIPYGTIGARASREKWNTLKIPVKHGRQGQNPAPTFSEESTRQSVANVVSDVWGERATASRDRWHRITKRVETHLEELDPSQVLAKAQSVKAINEISRKNLGIEAAQTTNVSLGVFTIGDHLESMDGLYPVIEGDYT